MCVECIYECVTYVCVCMCVHVPHLCSALACALFNAECSYIAASTVTLLSGTGAAAERSVQHMFNLLLSTDTHTRVDFAYWTPDAVVISADTSEAW